MTWAAFFYAGMRARRQEWLVWAGVYLGVLMVAFGIDVAVGEKDEARRSLALSSLRSPVGIWPTL